MLTTEIPVVLRGSFNKLSKEQQVLFEKLYSKKKKTLTTSYLLWFCFGLHYVYFNKIAIQVIFWLTGGGLFVWYIIDLFRISTMVIEANKEIAKQILIEVKTLI